MSDSDKNIGRSYSLSALFLLVTACAAMTAMVALLVRTYERFGIGVGDVVKASIQWSIAFLCIGAIIGCFHARPGRGMLWGALIGLILGLLAGPVALIPSSHLPFILLTSMIGAVVLLAVSATIRLTTKYGHTDPHTAEHIDAANTAKPHPLDPDPEE